MGIIPKLWNPLDGPKPRLTFTDMHIHTEFSLKDGMIRILDQYDPKHNKGEIIAVAESRNTGAVTATDHGNMYGQAILASAANKYGLKHIPACEFYIAPGSRFDKNAPKGSTVYRHICGWAKDVVGYKNLCALQKLSYNEGFYQRPRIDKELVDKYGDGIIWSDACMGGTISSVILEGNIQQAHDDMLWYLNRFKDDYYIEYQNHGILDEDRANEIKLEWAYTHGIPVIATTDAHYARKEDVDAHRTLLCTQWGNWFDNPAFDGFQGDGYWLMNDDELLARFPVEYINNTQLIVDKVEGGIIKFGQVTPPQYRVPDWFMREIWEG